MTFHRRARFTGRTRSPPILSVFSSFFRSFVSSFIHFSFNHRHTLAARAESLASSPCVFKGAQGSQGAQGAQGNATRNTIFTFHFFVFSLCRRRSIALTAPRRRGRRFHFGRSFLIRCVFVSVDLFIFGEFTGDQGAQGAQGSQGAQGDQGFCALIARDAPAEKFKHTTHHAIHFVSHFAATHQRRSSFAE